MKASDVEVRTVGQLITLQFPFDREFIASLKQIGMRWDAIQKHWHCKDTPLNRDLLKKLLYPAAPVTKNTNNYIPASFLMKHQKDGVELAKEKKRWLFAWDTGVGKTATAIEIYQMRKIKSLVICPLSIIEQAWMEDIRKFAPGIKATNLWKLGKLLSKNGNGKKETYIKELVQTPMGIINFEAFKAQRPYLEAADFKMVFIDESSKIKSNKSQITKDITSFCEDMEYVYEMSGTPAPNTPLEYYPQIRVVDPTVFGRSYWGFRNKYFYECGFKWMMKLDMKAEFEQKLASCMSVIHKDDVLDLPEQTWNIRDVALSPEEIKVYREMAKKLVAELSDKFVTAANAAVKIGKLRQITSGFIIDDNDTVHNFGKSKNNELAELLEEIGNHQVIIWCQFHEEGRQIKKMLKDKAEIINGTIPQAERESSISRFKQKSLQYLIAHPKSMGHGHTLTTCSYAIYYSMDYSYESWKQSADRIHRYGQKNSCTYYSLIAPGTIDQIIYRALQTKGDVQNAVLNYIKNYKMKGAENNE
jgi:SNF2 family DNA or RNA helicase